MVMPGPTCAVAVCSAGVLPFSPVYQNTVFAGVPFTKPVEVSGGEPLTRSGGSLKKSLAAAIAEAAGSAVCVSPVMAVVKAVCRLVAVSEGNVPMVNWLAPGGEFVVACSEMVWRRAIRKRELELDRVARIRIGSEIDRDRCRRTRWPGDRCARQTGIHAGKLKAEWRTVLTERQGGTRAATYGDAQMTETADAEIGLLTFRDHLGQTGLGAIAIENVRGAGDGRLVGALPEKM